MILHKPITNRITLAYANLLSPPKRKPHWDRNKARGKKIKRQEEEKERRKRLFPKANDRTFCEKKCSKARFRLYYVSNKRKKKLNKLKLSEVEKQNICAQTTAQCLSDVWIEEWHIRLTASNFGVSLVHLLHCKEDPLQ